MQKNSETKLILDNLTGQFFSLFTNKEGNKLNLENIYTLFIPEGMIIKNTGAAPEINTLEQFITPRNKILSDGTLVDFCEQELSERTEIFGNIAQRFSLYQKSGILLGNRFETKGMKTIQFIRTPDGWKISFVAWDDERDGLAIPAEFN